ncbi:sushi, von Willebrand factor type A, EGF and pentraxin domain-containing protein 1-like [Halichondria panicea]|uniref:sushi, von Willebrand factor type A, EGF and pentraxin domain-containing protein 1-like n=1 Tax=Halichondria panicea TaxID=6063 RepID=UPI00312B4233
MNANIGGPTPDTTYQGKVIYTCVSGYRISNGDTTAIATCMDDRTWGPLPICQLVDCGSPLTISILNGSPGEPSSTTYQGTVTYTCVSGYEVSTGVTTAMATCMASGMWGPLPTCQPVNCGSPTTISNGSPETPTSTTLGGMVTYTCNTGHEVSTGVTTAMATCMASGMWGPLPTCQPVSCGAPPPGTNASPGTPTSTVYQGTVTYTCVSGYWISQGSFSKFASCMADRTWGPLPTCSLVDCGSPPTIGNASPGTQTRTTYQWTVTYTCDTGYEVSNGVTTAVATCMASGAWGPLPTCQRVTCGDPPDTGLNASPGTPTPDTTYQYQETVTYTCDTGYQISNEALTAMVTCMADRTWGPLPTCQLVDCGSPPPGINAYPRTPTSTTYRGTVLYTCDTGYEISNGVTTAMATCVASGMWEAVPTCTIVDCGDPPTIPNGSPGTPTRTAFGGTVSYTCNNRYHMMSESATVTCEASGSWSTRPTCSAICNDHQIENGDINYDPDTTPRTEGNIALYSCVSGYQLSGVSIRVCMDGRNGMEGVWTGSMPSCIGITCSALPNVTNGTIDYSSGTTAPYNYGTTATYQCNHGHTLTTGDRVGTCTSNGSTPDGHWDAVDCGTLASITNGSPGTPTTTTFTGTVTYSCNDGYALFGIATSTCQANATWSRPPECRGTVHLLVCPDLMDLVNGSIAYDMETIDDRPVDTVATYTCDIGYTLIGNSTRTCGSDGVWSGSDPACEGWWKTFTLC